MSDKTFDSISVMVVDDDDVLSQPAVTRIVENLRARVSLTALNGREAVERLEDRAVPVHLIICDVEMPEMGADSNSPAVSGTAPSRTARTSQS